MQILKIDSERKHLFNYQHSKYINMALRMAMEKATSMVGKVYQRAVASQLTQTGKSLRITRNAGQQPSLWL